MVMSAFLLTPATVYARPNDRSGSISPLTRLRFVGKTSIADVDTLQVKHPSATHLKGYGSGASQTSKNAFVENELALASLFSKPRQLAWMIVSAMRYVRLICV